MKTRSDFIKIWNEISTQKFYSVSQENLFSLKNISDDTSQEQTNHAFGDKWGKYEQSSEKEVWYQMQKKWYLSLYGFETESDLAEFLRTKKVIFDAGCGLGYKSAWFAKLAPDSLVIGVDFSNAVEIAAKNYANLGNLLFSRGDIAKNPFLDGSIDYVSCDQVIMHSQDPDQTFKELVRIANPVSGEFSCYFYAKKALPRELLDDHFRKICKSMSSDQLWEMSNQLTTLGKNLSELKQTIEVPDIPALQIKGGTYDLQRFIYWNLLKCFWNEELGEETSVVTNFDWYSPSNARRYSEKEVKDLINNNNLEIKYFHQEEACFSGRFAKNAAL